MRNREVVNFWARSRSARNHEGSLSSDGPRLYSYNKMIGYTENDGRKVIIDYTAPNGKFLSHTTSCHVGLGKLVADVIDQE